MTRTCCLWRDMSQRISLSENTDSLSTIYSLWKHNVVIAVLLGGEYGISSAARVAKDMLHSR
jgi:hypothetical protein